MENKNAMNEFTFTDLIKKGIRTIKRHIILFIASILVITFLGTYVFGYKKNKDSSIYTAVFSIKSNMADTTSIVYTDIISTQNVLKLKAKVDAGTEGYTALKGIDFGEMLDNNKISISIDEKTKSIITLTVNQNCFKDKEQAKTFVTKLNEVFIEGLTTPINNETNAKTINNLFDNAVSYDDKITVLEEQVSRLQSNYDTLSKSVTRVNGVSIEQCKEHVRIISKLIANLKEEQNVYNYAPYNEGLQKKYQEARETLQLELNLVQSQIDDLLVPSLTITNTDIFQTKLNLSKKIIVLQAKEEYAGMPYDSADAKAEARNKFEESLGAKSEDSKIVKELIDRYAEYCEIANEASKMSTNVSYNNISIILASSASSYIVVAIASFAVAMVISFVLAYLAEVIKKVMREDKLAKEKQLTEENVQTKE